MTEYAAHLHEHFVDPAEVRSGRYITPSRPGFSTELKPEAIAQFRFPDGPIWSSKLPVHSGTGLPQ